MSAKIHQLHHSSPYKPAPEIKKEETTLIQKINKHVNQLFEQIKKTFSDIKEKCRVLWTNFKTFTIQKVLPLLGIDLKKPVLDNILSLLGTIITIAVIALSSYQLLKCFI